MTGFVQASRAIETLFAAEWPSGNPISPVPAVYYDNQKGDPADNAIWARFSIQEGEANRMSLGPKALYRYVGIAFVQVFVPLRTGTGNGRLLADHAASILRDRRIPVTEGGYVQFRAPSIRNVGSTASWWQINVNAPFHRDWPSPT